ncbi:MAG: CDP-alcohol phosphatidyltransferase family protein [Myxococcales bacterium]|nr:CDP-alcohol phosphatidyltransferase family protein [Myxococcales bacterium]
MRLQLKKSLFLLPNMLTLSSVFCGFYATVLAANAEQTDSLYRASVFIVLAMLLDTIDGRVARLTRTQSALGVQLDSLADVISFGVAPAFLVYRWSLEDLGSVGLIAVFLCRSWCRATCSVDASMTFGSRGLQNIRRWVCPFLCCCGHLGLIGGGKSWPTSGFKLPLCSYWYFVVSACCLW